MTQLHENHHEDTHLTPQARSGALLLAEAMTIAGTETMGDFMEYCREHRTTPLAIVRTERTTERMRRD